MGFWPENDDCLGWMPFFISFTEEETEALIGQLAWLRLHWK